MCQLIEVFGCDVVGVKSTQVGQVEEDVCGVVTQLTRRTWCV